MPRIPVEIPDDILNELSDKRIKTLEIENKKLKERVTKLQNELKRAKLEANATKKVTKMVCDFADDLQDFAEDFKSRFMT